ncbi:hypothetical protein LCGC14_1445590, partial [marine sediment metagenome]
LFPFADAHISCNDDWWEYYWPKSAILREMGVEPIQPSYGAVVNYPRINAGASGFTEVITSNVLHRLEIG